MSYATDQVYVYSTTEALPTAKQLSLPAKSADALPPPPESPHNEYLAMMQMKKGAEGGSSIDSEEHHSDDSPPPPNVDDSLVDVSNFGTFNDQPISLISKPLSSNSNISINNAMIPPTPPPQAYNMEMSDAKQMESSFSNVPLNSYISDSPTFARQSFPKPILSMPVNTRSKSTNNLQTNISNNNNNKNRNSKMRSSSEENPAVEECLADDPLKSVSFTSLLRQVDVGIEMMDHLKEVVRKFSKHQQTGADKLQEIYQKYKSKYNFIYYNT